MRKSSVYFLLISLVFGVRVGVSIAAPKGGGVLRFGLEKDIVSVNPFQRTSSVTKNVGSIAFECLLTTDKRDELKPALATAWEVSRDGTQYVFTLRKGVKFHNGKEMTAEDVLWSIQYASDPGNAAAGKYIVAPIVSATASNPLTLRITLKEPYVPFLTGLASFEAFPVVPSKSVPSGREKVEIHPPGTGPFMMTEYRPNQLIVFKRFDQYWQKGLPHLEGVHFQPVEDATVRFTSVRTGDLDVVERMPYDQVDRVRKGEVKDLGLETAQASGYVAPTFQTDKPPFNNLKVRQAVVYAIDKQKVLEGVTWGFGIEADQKIPRGSRWFVPLPERKRDIEKAKALLREAGYTGGLKVKAQVARSKRDQDLMQIIQSQLKDADIHLEIEVRDFAKHMNDLRDGSFTLSMSASAPSADPDFLYYDWFHTAKEARAVANFSRYSNAKVDSLLEAGRKEPDFQKRYRIYKELLETLHDEVPEITIGFTPHTFAFRKSVKDFHVQPTGPFFYGLGGLAMTWIDR
jgi:peptide/nickel transport system substrate-binding protein